MMINPELDINILDGYKKIPWSEDYYAATADGKYSLWFYNVNEVTMGSYYGHLGIFNKDNLLIISSGKVWIHYNFSSAFVYAQRSDCMIFKMPVYEQEISDYPYLLVRPASRCFTLIKSDFTSIYYSLEEVNENLLRIVEESPKELDRVNYKRRTGEEINLDSLPWYSLDDFKNAREIYLNNL